MPENTALQILKDRIKYLDEDIANFETHVKSYEYLLALDRRKLVKAREMRAEIARFMRETGNA